MVGYDRTWLSVQLFTQPRPVQLKCSSGQWPLAYVVQSAECLSLQVRVYHDNTGPTPSWFLEEVRVRRAGIADWAVFPCQRWLAVDQEDG